MPLDSSTIVDIYDDAHYSLLSEHGEKIASYRLHSHEEVAKLPDTAFAVIIKTASGESRRKYPCHTRDAHEISKFYFDKVASTLPTEVADAARSGLADASARPVVIDLSHETPVKVASVFGITIAGKGYFPIETPELVKAASESFRMSCDTLRPSERYEYAQNIMKQASLLKVDIGNTVLDYSGTELSKTAWHHGVQQRTIECADSVKIAALKAYVPTDAKDAIAYLGEWDKTASVSHKRIPDPYASVYGTLEKSSASKVSHISGSQLKDVFGEEFAVEWDKDPAAVYASLPTPDRELIDERFSC